MGEEILGGVSSDDVEAARLNLARILDMGMMESGQAVQRMKRAERQGYNREAGAMTRRVIAVDSSGYVATSLPEPGTGQTFAARPDSVRVICLSSGASERLLRSLGSSIQEDVACHGRRSSTREEQLHDSERARAEEATAGSF